MRRLALVLAFLVYVPACSGSDSIATETTTLTVQFEDQGPFVVTRPLGCDAESGSAVDLESEPAFWLAFGDYMRWVDIDGCPVRIDVIAHHHLAEHCGWGAAESITVGQTLDEPFENSENSRRFVWNRDGVIPGFESGATIPRASLPDSARDTGYRQGQAELWVDDSDTSVLLIVNDSVKVFRLGTSVGICA
jgi:hypothetical protein